MGERGDWAGRAADLAIDEHQCVRLARFERLWMYYRNPMLPGPGPGPGGGYRLAQEAGLPRRITGVITGRGAAGDELPDDRAARREVVIENDIAWRVHAMVDFLFAKPIALRSTARDEGLARTIDAVLDAVWEGSGGIALLQDAALLGHVYGHVDLLVRRTADRGGSIESMDGGGFDPRPAARAVRVEVVEPRRGVPILDPSDFRRLLAYVVTFERELNEPEEREWSLARLTGRAVTRRKREAYAELITPEWTEVSRGGGERSRRGLRGFGGELPVVHIQNIAQPFAYEGLSEVEPLIPLQDELNTRLSDRASRVTMQSFKMYLARGIEGFDQRPVGPGQVWSTQSPEASIQEFGGDQSMPGEEAHIREVREALDKVSGVPPLASGVVRAKIGNLTSANALRITLMGLLAKTSRKRVTYGGGIARASGLILSALDDAGILKTDPRDRGVRVEWADPLPEDAESAARVAAAKARLGVPRERVLKDLGETREDMGVT